MLYAISVEKVQKLESLLRELDNMLNILNSIINKFIIKSEMLRYHTRY